MAWGNAAQERGFVPVHYSFVGHKSPLSLNERTILTPEQLREANPRCKLAAAELDRRWPPSSDYTCKLFQRNWWQVRKTNSVYAIGTIEAETSKLAGGTAWAVQMYINTNFVGKPLRLYVFDQPSRIWFQYTGAGYDPETKLIHWSPLAELPPMPYADFTGIGSRDILAHGLAAIEKVMRIT